MEGIVTDGRDAIGNGDVGQLCLVKADDSIERVDSGSSIVCSCVSENSSGRMMVIESERLASVMRDPRNAPSPSCVTDSGSRMLVRPDARKAPMSTVVTDSGNVMEVSRLAL